MPFDPQAVEQMEKLARMKAIIGKLESSGGQNMDHAPLTQGPNAGQTAGGAYGIVPNSLKDFAHQSMNRNIPVDVDLLAKMDEDPTKVTQELNNNRKFDDQAAEMALKLILQKAGGNEEKAAYAWRTGQNQSDEKMQQGLSHPYVEAYRKEKALYEQNRKPAGQK